MGSRRHQSRPNAQKARRERASKEGARTTVCSSGKVGYPTRAGGKAAARRGQRQGGDLLDTYLCTECDTFHNGHLPKAVREGRVSRHDYYDRD